MLDTGVHRVYTMSMTVKFPVFKNLRFSERHAPIYHGLLKSAKHNPFNPKAEMTEEIMFGLAFYLKYKDRVKELEETKQS